MSGAFRTIDPPVPTPSPPSGCPPPAPKAGGGGGTHSPGGEGGGGVNTSEWKTPDIGLATYNIIPLLWRVENPEVAYEEIYESNNH